MIYTRKYLMFSLESLPNHILITLPNYIYNKSACCQALLYEVRPAGFLTESRSLRRGLLSNRTIFPMERQH